MTSYRRRVTVVIFLILKRAYAVAIVRLHNM